MDTTKMSLYTIFTIKRRLPYLGYDFQNALDTESHIQPKVRVFTTKLIRHIPYHIHAHVVDTAILSCDEQINISHNITALNGYLYNYNAEEPRVINASSLSSEIDYIDLKSIAGEYAITHINADGVLRAFSDPERIRSLYYINTDDVFGVSTRPAMLARLAQNMSCDLEWLAAISAIGYGIGTRTAYKKIKSVPQGATLQWDGVNIDISYNNTRRIYSNRGLASNPEYVSEQIDKSIYAVNSAIKLASKGSDEISLGITGGKDSRLLLALCLAGGLKSRLRLFTVGYPDHPDCIVGSQIAAAVGIRHEVRSPSPGAVNPYLDPSAFLDRISISSFQTDGLCGCWDMILGKKTGKNIVMSGFMGEIFKAFDKSGNFRTDVPFQGSDIVKLQSPFDPIGLLNKESKQRLSKEVIKSVSKYLNLGFYNDDLPDLFYYANRIPNWLGNARQVQGFTGINVMPLGVPPLIDLAFFARANERATEMIHYNIIRKLSPELLDMPFALQSWHPSLGAPNRGVVGMPDRAMPVHGSWQHSINKRRDVRKAVESLVSETDSNLWRALDRNRLVNHLRSEESNMLQIISILGILPALYFETQTFKPTKIETDDSNIAIKKWESLSGRRKAVIRVIDRLSSVRQVSSSKQRHHNSAVIRGAILPPEAEGHPIRGQAPEQIKQQTGSRMNKLVPHKAALANHAVRKHSVTSFADIGACWGVHAGYSIDVLAKNPIKKAYVADADVTKQSRAAAKPYPQLEFIEGQFNEPDFIQAFPKVDALIMYDILLHQANLDWDKFLAAWSKKTNIFIIYNQMWTKNEKTIRFLDNGLDWYLDNVFYINKDKVVEWFEKLDESHPLFGRKWRDSQQFWQFGITTADLIGTMKEIGFKLDYFENFGPFHPTRTPWIDTEGFVFVRST